jgi:hypothetical protein
VRTLAIKFFQEGVEFPLLLQDVGTCRTRGLLFQSQMHPFMTAVLLRMTGLNALSGDSQAQPPDRELGELKQFKMPGKPVPGGWIPSLRTVAGSGRHDR